MPLDPAQHAALIGRYQHRRTAEVSGMAQQDQLHRIAMSQQCKLPRGDGVLAGVYGMLLLSQVCGAGSSPLRLSRVAPLQRELQCSATANNALFSLQGADDAAASLHLLQSLSPPAQDGKAARAAVWGLPLVAAQEAIRFGPFRWWQQHKILMAEGDSSKDLVLQLARNFLVKNDLVSADCAEQLENAWRRHAAGEPLLLMPVASARYFPRDKRISEKKRNEHIMAHIAEHCAFEAEIVNVDEVSEGMMLMFKAQRWENPFTFIYDLAGNAEVAQHHSAVADGLNHVADILSLGIKPVIGDLIASYYRQAYYEKLGDSICTTRQVRIRWARILTALDIDGTFPYDGKIKSLKKPVELQNAVPYASDAAYFSRNKDVGTESELLLVATVGGTADSAAQQVLLKPTGRSEFRTIAKANGAENHLNRIVRVEEQQGIWHFADGDGAALQNVEMREGETLIKVLGDKYPLRKGLGQKHEIHFLETNGQWRSLPVYQNPFSKQWHLEKVNHHPVFTATQSSFLRQLKVESDNRFQYRMIDNLNPGLYGDGKLFEVRLKNDDIAASAPLYMLAEMEQQLVPVRISVRPGSGVCYEVYDLAAPFQNGHPIAWDKDVWRFDRRTSQHVSDQLKRLVTPNMYERNLDVAHLLPADSKGVRYSATGESYLKVNQHYVLLEQGRDGSASYVGKRFSKQIEVRYHHGRFYPAQLLPEWPGRSTVAAASLNAVISLIKGQLLSGLKSVALEKLLQTRVAANALSVEAAPSGSLDARRFVVNVVSEQLIFDLPLDGSGLQWLEGEEKDSAQEKYRHRVTGGVIEHVLGLRRAEPIQLIPTSSSSMINDMADARIEAGARSIRALLADRRRHQIKGKTLILGGADFMGSAIFENNVFSTPRTMYQALVDFMIPVSEDYPEALIVPGSFYISTDIPAALRDKSIVYKQGSIVRKLENAFNFVSVLAPVFYRGKLVTVARKGELMSCRASGADDANESASVPLIDLDAGMASRATLVVHNYPRLAGGSSGADVDSRTGAVFSGRTLLPGERELAEKLFCPYASTHESVDMLFNNAFMIEGEKFLLVVEDEFKSYGNGASSVRLLALPPDDAAQGGIRYDWILHVAAGDGVDQSLQQVADNYLHADSGTRNEFVSETVERRQLSGYAAGGKLQVFDYRTDDYHV